MDQQRIEFLHHQYLNNGLSGEELTEWEALLEDEKSIPVLKSLLEANWEGMEVRDRISLDEHKSAAILEYIKVHPQFEQPKRMLWPRIGAVAAILLLISGILFFKTRELQHSGNVYVSDVQPGKNTATLTLGNGQKIKLSTLLEGELAEDAGVMITKTADGELVYEMKNDAGAAAHEIRYNTLTTARGEAYRLRLPDGSLVFLNAASSLKYPIRFKSKERKVELSGEGYFEVAHNSGSPFIVATAHQEVEVLGTKFNINSYLDEQVTKTTLLEGAVRVMDLNSKKAGLLKPGQQSILKAGKLNVITADTETDLGWTKGDFIFKYEDFRTVMRKIARWYDVEIVYETDAPLNVQIGGWVSRENNISTVLEMIASTGKVHFKVEGRRIIVSK